MISKDEIFVRIQQILRYTFEVNEQLITQETHLFNDLELDSFDAVDLAVMLEVYTSIKLKEDDIRTIRTISDIIEVIHKKIIQDDKFEE